MAGLAFDRQRRLLGTTPSDSTLVGDASLLVTSSGDSTIGVWSWLSPGEMMATGEVGLPHEPQKFPVTLVPQYGQ
jgi:hypothetical protein